MGKELARTWRDAVGIFRIPKKPYDIKMWRDVQVWFWRSVSLFLLWNILPHVVSLVRALR